MINSKKTENSTIQFILNLNLVNVYLKASEPKCINSILNIIGVNSFRLGGLHIMFLYINLLSLIIICGKFYFQVVLLIEIYCITTVFFLTNKTLMIDFCIVILF